MVLLVDTRVGEGTFEVARGERLVRRGRGAAWSIVWRQDVQFAPTILFDLVFEFAVRIRASCNACLQLADGRRNIAARAGDAGKGRPSPGRQQQGGGQEEIHWMGLR